MIVSSLLANQRLALWSGRILKEFEAGCEIYANSNLASLGIIVSICFFTNYCYFSAILSAIFE
jgi:hypothetical protein